MRLFLFGPSDATERDRIEKALKADKLVKATQLKHTRKEAEAARIAMGLRAGGASYGIGTEPSMADQMDITLEELMKKSDVTEFRKGGDAIKALAIDEEHLSNMPWADQPTQLASALLPYQLQVRTSIAVTDATSTDKPGGSGVDELQGKPQAPSQEDGQTCSVVGAECPRQVLKYCLWIRHAVPAHALFRRYSCRRHGARKDTPDYKSDPNRRAGINPHRCPRQCHEQLETANREACPAGPGTERLDLPRRQEVECRRAHAIQHRRYQLRTSRQGA